MPAITKPHSTASVLETLLAVRETLTDEANWTPERLALDKDNVPVATHSHLARRWCLFGAIVRIAATAAIVRLTRGLLDPIARQMAPADLDGYTPLVYVNNVLGHQATLELLDRGIATLAQQPVTLPLAAQ